MSEVIWNALLEGKAWGAIYLDISSGILAAFDLPIQPSTDPRGQFSLLRGRHDGVDVLNVREVGVTSSSYSDRCSRPVAPKWGLKFQRG